MYDRFHAFFGIFWPIELKFFMGTQETIIYRLVLKNLGFGPYLLFSIFWVLTKGVAPQGPQNPTKKLTHLVEILGHLLSRNHVSNFFDLGTDAANHLTHLYFFYEVAHSKDASGVKIQFVMNLACLKEYN